MKDCKINLGGGNTKKKGFINIDVINFENVDIVHDITKGIPLEDSSVEEIYSSHFVEHVPDLISLMNEIYRVCKNNALVKIKAPYFKSIGAFKDPTHKIFITEKTFEYFDKEKMGTSLPEYNISTNFKILKISYLWSNKIIRFLPFKKTFFLKYFWNIARSIYIELKVVK